MSSSLTAEPLDNLAISSSAFGILAIYEVPRLHIEGMTSQKIIDHVTKIASAGGSSSAMVVHLDPQLTEMLHLLHCGERLKADLPVTPPGGLTDCQVLDVPCVNATDRDRQSTRRDCYSRPDSLVIDATIRVSALYASDIVAQG